MAPIGLNVLRLNLTKFKPALQADTVVCTALLMGEMWVSVCPDTL